MVEGKEGIDVGLCVLMGSDNVRRGMDSRLLEERDFPPVSSDEEESDLGDELVVNSEVELGPVEDREEVGVRLCVLPGRVKVKRGSGPCSLEA